tara:strand:- start:16 stop:924 length:909 start_codon:yes stop_codon:yes gene_type:complete
MNKKIIIILGPTATGKTNLAVKLALKHNAEIISADSRQIYRSLDIGTGKDLEEYNIRGKKIKYHLIDIISPNDNYSVYNFQIDFEKIFKKIKNTDKNIIICGGTGLYIESLLLDYNLSSSPPPNYDLRNKLNDKSLDELIKYQNEINDNYIKAPITDTKNRVIRNIEKCLNRQTSLPYKGILPLSNYIIVGINQGRTTVREKITKRLKSRLSKGMIQEVENLLKMGVSHDRLYYFGLEYRFVSKFIKGEMSKTELFKNLNTAIHKFSKKQMTFFRRMERRGIKINWISDNKINLLEKNNVII